MSYQMELNTVNPVEVLHLFVLIKNQLENN